nr:MAG TPA: hypothetical protein [Caudoviricetes sp.]
MPFLLYDKRTTRSNNKSNRITKGYYRGFARRDLLLRNRN